MKSTFIIILAVIFILAAGFMSMLSAGTPVCSFVGNCPTATGQLTEAPKPSSTPGKPTSPPQPSQTISIPTNSPEPSDTPVTPPTSTFRPSDTPQPPVETPLYETDTPVPDPVVTDTRSPGKGATKTAIPTLPVTGVGDAEARFRMFTGLALIILVIGALVIIVRRRL